MPPPQWLKMEIGPGQPGRGPPRRPVTLIISVVLGSIWGGSPDYKWVKTLVFGVKNPRFLGFFYNGKSSTGQNPRLSCRGGTPAKSPRAKNVIFGSFWGQNGSKWGQGPSPPPPLPP